MRLVALLLILAGSLEAQAPRRLPWEGLPALPWQQRVEDFPEAPPPPPAPTDPATFRVRLREEGGVKVLDRRGIVRLRSGLPGRPLRVWRDAGRPLPPPWKELRFGADPGGMWRSAALAKESDPREALAGLLWIQDDSGRFLTLVHPATGQVAFLPLPDAEEPALSFLPEGLGLQEAAGGGEAGGGARRWLLPWVALLPCLLRLEALPEDALAGTALQPFPREKGW